MSIHATYGCSVSSSAATDAAASSLLTGLPLPSLNTTSPPSPPTPLLPGIPPCCAPAPAAPPAPSAVSSATAAQYQACTSGAMQPSRMPSLTRMAAADSSAVRAYSMLSTSWSSAASTRHAMSRLTTLHAPAPSALPACAMALVVPPAAEAWGLAAAPTAMSAETMGSNAVCHGVG
ncbi:unnamed protein product [Closterium sp. NIES-54]